MSLGYHRPVPEMIDLAPVIAELVRGELVRSDLMSGPRTNQLRRIELADGRVLAVKQYARGRDYAVEGAAVRELTGVVPVPDIVCTLDRVIAYRWIAGPTLAEAARREPAIWSRLASALGAMLGALARVARPAPPPLTRGLDPTRARLGDELADVVAAAAAAPSCLVHGALSPEHVILTPAADGIAGVVDWETAAAGSPLLDVGRLLRDATLTDAAVAGFAAAHGGLPERWRTRACLLDAAAQATGHGDDAALATVRSLARYCR